MIRFSGFLMLVVGLIGFAVALGAPHPLHDDGGAVNWRQNMRAALEAAQRSGKPIFLEAGREG